MNLKPLRDALRSEHLYACTNNTCDISAAYNAGLYLWAARLLTGATEAPETEAALARLEEVEVATEKERGQMTWGVACSACDAPIYVDDVDGVACGNCGAVQRVEPEEELEPHEDEAAYLYQGAIEGHAQCGPDYYGSGDGPGAWDLGKIGDGEGNGEELR